MVNELADSWKSEIRREITITRRMGRRSIHGWVLRRGVAIHIGARGAVVKILSWEDRAVVRASISDEPEIVDVVVDLPAVL